MPPSRRGAHSLEVRVVHASLQHAREPVVVGHYQGTPITGAEAALDERLGGLLSDRLLLGAYAEQEGTAVLVGPSDRTTPSGGLVLGLGPAGELTPAKISRAMTQAVLLRALFAAECRLRAAEPEGGGGKADDEPVVVGISAVLVGTSPLEGMPIPTSLAALVEGTVTAIQLLRDSPTVWAKVRVGLLEVVERWGQRAAAAADALDALPVAQGSAVKLRRVKELDGGKDRGGEPGQPSAAYSKEAWWRLDIRSVPPSRDLPKGYREIEFTSMSRRARADRLLQRIEVSTVNDLIAEAVSRARPDPQICNTLYELLVPPDLKYDLGDAANVHLLLDEDTACYPWEALAPQAAEDGRTGPSHTGVLRQFAERETRSARFGVRRASGRHVLVIGNPPAGPSFPDLPGAAAEAQAVAKFFGRERDVVTDHEVHALIWGDEGVKETDLPHADDGPSWVHIVNALYRFEYRIVHIAAHGMFDADDPARSGVLIGPDRYLTAQTIRQLPVVPELVFLNCCHTGRLGDLPGSVGERSQRAKVNLLAASVSRELMAIGVRAVIAAGWAVDDAAASGFATTFYGKALDGGCSLGEAVRATRDEIRKASPDSLTWAAFQCYGDPEFRLRAADSTPA